MNVLTVLIASIDIGVKNFAIYTEEVNLSQLNEIKKKSSKRKIILPSDDELNRVYNCGRGIDKYTNVFDLSNGENVSELSVETRRMLFDTLSKYDDMWKNVSIVIIEKQFINLRAPTRIACRGGSANMIMIRLAESCFTWILDHYPSIKIFYFPASYKTMICGCPRFFEKKQRKTGTIVTKKATKYDRKRWSEMKGKEILELRGDNDILNRIITKKRGTHKQKLDDICDCILQLQAYKWLEMVETIA